jgi:acetylglutamate kinase
VNSDRGPGVVEASAYIEAFRDRIVVVKLGGELLDGGPVLDRILPQVAVLYRCGLRPLLVHGGGKQADAECRARGIERVKYRGRRVTTPEVMEVMLDVVAGTLNRAIVDRLRREGVPAIGFAEGASEAVRCRLRKRTTETQGAQRRNTEGHRRASG